MGKTKPPTLNEARKALEVLQSAVEAGMLYSNDGSKAHSYTFDQYLIPSYEISLELDRIQSDRQALYNKVRAFDQRSRSLLED